MSSTPPPAESPARAGRLSPRLRISFFYGAYFAMSGIHLPFWPVWLSARGVGPGELGLMLGVAAWARVLASPLVGNLADLSGERRRPAIWCAGASLLVAAQFLWAEGFWPFLALSILFGLAWSPILPFGESLALAGARIGQFDYGRVRVWGSVSFMLVNLGAGL
ncbi:MAG: MFS transporter, partial [Alphaproteobacteria bacterium]|nr:MFS transporter [Alphaproteobacteria bacterium]